MRGVLALDQGSHASRACVFDEHGTLRAQARVAVATVRAGTDIVEQQPDELAASLLAAARSALAQAPELDIKRAGLATQRSTIACFDRRTGAALAPAISWQDRRAATWLSQFEAHAAEVRTLTGLPLSPHYGASKLRWCLDHVQDVRAAQRSGVLCAGPLAAFLVMRLTGDAPRCDPANASRSLLWDIDSREWSPRLLQLFGIDAAVLPACGPTRMAFGMLPLQPAIELRAVTGDQSAVPYAFGPPDVETAYINLGTGAFIQVPLARRPAASEPLLTSVLAADERQAVYSLEGTVNGAGAAVSVLASELALPEESLWPLLDGIDDSAQLPVYVNGIGGLGSPWWRAQQASYFLGTGDPAQRFAAVLESIVFLIAANFSLLAARGAHVRRVLVTGGLSRSDWLCRRLAATLQLPVRRCAAEASARGTAALADAELAAHWPQVTGTDFAPRSCSGLAARQQLLLDALG